jgi:hypothetical protein
MNPLTTTIILILVGLTDSYCQNHHYFDKWKAKEEIVAAKVVFLMDSTDSRKGKEFNETLGKLLSESLTEKGLAASHAFRQENLEPDVLVIKFEMLEPAFVKLNTFGADIPLCNRFEIFQLNKLPEKQNTQIKTTLAISVGKEGSGSMQASKALADLIYESIKR